MSFSDTLNEMDWGLHYYFPKNTFQKYDEDDKLGIPGNIVEWINQTLDGDHPKFVSVGFLLSDLRVFDYS